MPGDLTCAQFGFLIRRRLQLPPEKALFLFINGSLPSGAALMREAYEQHRDRDGFMYVQYQSEATFGSGTQHRLRGAGGMLRGGRYRSRSWTTPDRVGVGHVATVARSGRVIGGS